MDFTRWKFSKEVQPELEEFLKIVKNNKNSPVNSENKLWEQILPKNPLFCYDVDNESTNSNDVIIIEDDDDIDDRVNISPNVNTTSNLPDVSIITLSLPSQETQISEVELINFKTSVKECLNDNRLLDVEDIKKITVDLSKHLIDFMKFLNENVNENGLLKLGESLVKFFPINHEVLKHYCRSILLIKLLNSHTSITFMPIVGNLIKIYPEILRDEIFLPLLNKHLDQVHVFEEIYKLLSQGEKDNLLRDFLFSCVELEEGHIKLLLPLVPQITEFSLKQRVVNLMFNSADKFKDSKIYMKLLIEVIKTLNKDFLDQEPIFCAIIDKNKTIFKSSAEKALNIWFNNCNCD